MLERKHNLLTMTDTSKFAYDVIMRPGARESIWKKIIECLEKIKDGTNYEIADALGIKPEKVWKRTAVSELSCKDGAIFDTGLRRLSPDGNPCIVFSLSSRRNEYADVKKPERIEKTTTADYATAIFASTAAGKKLFQAEMFDVHTTKDTISAMQNADKLHSEKTMFGKQNDM